MPIEWNVLKSRLLQFLLGEYFADALRNTLVIVAPILLFFRLDNEQAALGTGVGALLISLTDMPGNRMHKFKTAFLSIGVFFCTALIFTSILTERGYTAVAFLMVTFLLSMLAIFGGRAGLTGTMAIILSTFLLGLHPDEPIVFSIYIFLGACWFYLISLVQISIWPYRSLNHAVFECMTSTADFLRVKAKCYDVNEPLEEAYQQTIALHIKVSQKQDQVRSLLLSDSKAMKLNHQKGERMLRTAIRMIELYEQVTAIHYDYAEIRSRLLPAGALPHIVKMINLLADDLDALSKVFLLPGKLSDQGGSIAAFNVLKGELHAIAGRVAERQSVILMRILKNLEDIADDITEIRTDAPLDHTFADQPSDTPAYKAFLPVQPLSLEEILNHFSFKSPVFRFSLRLAFSFFIAYLLTLMFPSEKYSYWMLLTIVIVARPKFGITWKRNTERLTGTLCGLVIGLLLLLFVKSAVVLLVLSVIFLLGFFAFNRLNYITSVACITPAVVICLSLYHGHTSHIFSERLYYTIAGCAIAFGGVYLFPVWERSQLKGLVTDAIHANQIYLHKVLEGRSGKGQGNELKLARKNAHTQLALLSESLQYMLLEPGRKKINIQTAYAVQSLVFRINSVITSILLAEREQNISEQMDHLKILSSELESVVKPANYSVSSQG